jgi:hypothetical protein
MILRKLVQIDDEGNAEATFALTQQQIGILLNYAVASLVDQGLATVEEVSPDQIESEAQKRVLESFTTEELPQA